MDVKIISFGELHKHVCQLANALISMGVNKGDRVCIYMPMIPEFPISRVCNLNCINRFNGYRFSIPRLLSL